jgi:hypothetical protein
MTTVIEKAWAQVRDAQGVEGAIRIDPDHPADFFAAQDGEGRLGLVLLLDDLPPAPPHLESLDITTVERTDGRWGLGIWLTARMLATPFAQLCDDVLESSRGVDRDRLGPFVINRLHRWQDLLEAASSGWSMAKLRGLIGELLFLREGLPVFGEAAAIRGWVGPYRAPQDFSLPQLWVEVKATFPSARSVRITSADQLAAPGRLLIAVYTLATLLPGDAGVTTQDLVSEIEVHLRTGGLDDIADDFNRRLSTLGYQRAAEYTLTPFRVDAVHFYEVMDGFPRITRDTLAPGIAEAIYDLELGALDPFEAGPPWS